MDTLPGGLAPRKSLTAEAGTVAGWVSKIHSGKSSSPLWAQGTRPPVKLTQRVSDVSCSLLFSVQRVRTGPHKGPQFVICPHFPSYPFALSPAACTLSPLQPLSWASTLVFLPPCKMGFVRLCFLVAINDML